MPTQTPNLNLEKPLGSEKYDINKLNANFDKIDTNALNKMTYKGEVALLTDLPSSNQKVGDYYIVLEKGVPYVWNGTEFKVQVIISEGGETAQSLGSLISSADAKTTPDVDDTFGYSDSEDVTNPNILKKFTWGNLRGSLATFFEGIFALVLHRHEIGDITDLVTTLSGKQPILHGLVSDRPTTDLLPGLSYFATDLKKRLDFNGTHWQFYDGSLFGVFNIVDGNIYPETAIYTTQTLVGGVNNTPQTVDATIDVIIYTGIKLNDADDYCHISFDIGAAPQFQLSFGYNWITSTKDGVSVSIIDAINSTKTLLGTKNMYDTSHDVVVWYDHSTGYVSIYIDNVLLNTWKPSAGANIAGVNQIKLMIGSSSTLVTVDYWYVAKPLVVAIGDSITEGSPLHSPNPTKYVGIDIYQGYPKLISDHLRSTGIKNYFVVNKGVGANTTAQMVSRFTTAVLNTTCKYVLIHGGINDFNDSPTGYSTPVSNKISMANTAISNSITPIILSVIPTKTANAGHDFATNVHNLEQTSYSSFNYVDLWATIEGVTPNTADDSKMADDVHPNATGYTSIADRIISNIIL